MDVKLYDRGVNIKRSYGNWNVTAKVTMPQLLDPIIDSHHDQKY